LELATQVAAKAKDVGVLEATPHELKGFCSQAQRQADERAAALRLIIDVLAAAHPDTKREIDFKAEAMVVGYLHHIGAASPDLLRYRSSALDQDTAIEVLNDAEVIATEALAASVGARFEDPATVDFAESLPSVAELRRAAATLRGASLWSRWGRDWRGAKVIWRKTFPSERKIVPLEAARRLLSAALWKERLFQLEANQAAKNAAGRYWRSAESPFGNLIAVANWMRSIRRVTPLSAPEARDLRRLACEGNSDDFMMIAAFAERAKELKLLDAFKEAHASHSSILRDAGRLSERASAFNTLLSECERIGLRENQPLKNLLSALDATTTLHALNRAIAGEPRAAAVASEIPAVTDVQRRASGAGRGAFACAGMRPQNGSPQKSGAGNTGQLRQGTKRFGIRTGRAYVTTGRLVRGTS
jgi:hypothetical protein